MNPVHQFWRMLQTIFDWLVRQGKADRRLLIFIWAARLVGLLGLMIYFGREKTRFSPTDLDLIQKSLLVFFAYCIGVGFLGVIKSEWFWSSVVKAAQALFEIVFYSVFFVLSQDVRSEIYYLFFLPVFYVISLSHRRIFSLLVVLFSLLGIFISMSLITLRAGTDFPYELFSIRLLFMATLAVIFFTRRREPLVVDIREQEQQIQSLLASLDTSFFVLDHKNLLQFVNPGMEARFGPYIRGQSLWSYLHLAQNEKTPPAIPPIDPHSNTASLLSVTLIARNGERIEVGLRFSPLTDPDGNLVGKIAHLNDPSQSKILVEGLRDQLKNTQARTHQLVTEMAKWLEAYRDLSQKLIASRQPEDVMQLLVDEVRQRTSSDFCALYLCENGQVFRKACSNKKITALENPPEAWLVGEGLLSETISEQVEAMVFNHPQQLPNGALNSLASIRDILVEHRIHHVLLLPFRSAGDLAGAFLLANKLASPGRITETGYQQSDLNFAAAITSMASIAIRNACLIEETLGRLKVIQTLNRFNENIAKADDFELLLDTIIDETCKIFDDAEVEIVMRNESDNQLKTVASSLGSPQMIAELSAHAGSGIAAAAISKQQMVYRPDLARELTSQRRHGSQLAAPLLSGEKTLGALCIFRTRPRSFNDHEQRMLTALAGPTAVAFEKWRLFFQEQESARQANAILKISHLINQDLNLERVFKTIIASLGEIIEFDSISIQMIEGEELRIKDCHGFTSRKKVLRLRFPLDNPQFPNYYVLKLKQTFIVEDVYHDFPHFDKERSKYHSEHIRSWMGVPIIISGKVVGMICFDHSHPGFFNQALGNLASVFANHIATAVQNARLFSEKNLNEKKLLNLYQIASELSLSLDYKELLKKIIHFAQSKTHASHTGILLLDEENQPYDSLETTELSQPLHLRIRPVIGVTQRVIDSKEPIFFDQVEPGSEHNPIILAEGFKSYAVIPVIASGKICAVLYVRSKKVRPFSQEKSLLLTLGYHAGVAIEKARYIEDTRRQAEMLESLVAVSRELIQQKKLESLLNYCALEGARIFNVEDCSLSLIDEKRNTVDLVASNCIPQQVWNTRDAFLDKPGLTAYVARTGQTLNLAGDEYKDHPSWAGKHEKPFLDHLEYLPTKGICRTLLLSALPDSRGKNLGVIKLENRIGIDAEKRFPKFQKILLENFASLIGLAVESARQDEQANQEIRRETRHALGRELHYIQNLLHGAVVLRLGAAQEELLRGHWELLGNELELMRKAASYVQTHLYNTQNDLAEDRSLEVFGLTPMLKMWAEFLQIHHGEISTTGRAKLPVKVEHVLYKIGLEALNNVKKHAGAQSQVEINLKINEDLRNYLFIIKDNGKGYDPKEVEAREDRFGLISIREWSKEINAKVNFEASPGAGTKIEISGAYE